jgi:hypothetical protein
MKTYLQMALFPLIQVASLLYAVLIFDTVGDKIGYKLAVIPTVAMILVPCLAWFVVNRYLQYHRRSKTVSKKVSAVRGAVLTKLEKDNGIELEVVKDGQEQSNEDEMFTNNILHVND